MKIQLPNNDNVYELDYYEDGNYIEVNNIDGNDIDHLYVMEGVFPNVKYVSLESVLLREAQKETAIDAAYKNEYEEERLTKDQLGLK